MAWQERSVHIDVTSKWIRNAIRVLKRYAAEAGRREEMEDLPPKP